MLKLKDCREMRMNSGNLILIFMLFGLIAIEYLALKTGDLLFPVWFHWYVIIGSGILILTLALGSVMEVKK